MTARPSCNQCAIIENYKSALADSQKVIQMQKQLIETLLKEREKHRKDPKLN